MNWYAILPRVWNMSLTASVVILVVLAARLVLRKAPAVFRYVLWGAVLFRLLCPVSFSSAVSVFGMVGAPVNESGGMEYVPENIVHTAAPEVELPIVGDTVNTVINEKLPQGEEQLRADPLEAPVTLLTWLWTVGAGGMLVYGIVGWLRLRRQLVGPVALEKNIRLADGIETAFVLGVLRPVIWLPSAMPPAERELVIRHERQHLRHGDHVFRFLGWCALCLHWFNPLVWLAFRLSGRDMEHACDEAVIKKAGRDIRAEYSYTLLHCAAGRARFAGTPLTFGENDVKSRVKNVMRYKKPAVLAVVLAVVFCAVLAVCLLTNPKNDADGSAPVATVQPELADAAAAESTAAPLTGADESTAADGTAAGQPTVPTLEPILAQQTIQLILSTLRITEEHSLSFRIPSLPPKAEDGTELFITLNATWRLSDGSYTVQSLVDNVSGWVSGDALSISPEKQEGELIRVMLRAAYCTPVGENAYKEMAASYVQLTAPFDCNAAPVLEEPTASIEYRNGESRIHINLQNGDRAILSLALPEGFVLAENWEKSADPAMPPAVAVLWQGSAVGTLRLYPFAGDYADVDPAGNELPMPIFAEVALSDHTGYDDYTVVHSTDSGAAATAKYVWQQLTGTVVKDAAALPWNSRDCILAYDWSAMHCYMELVLEEGLVSARELEKIAHSVRWQKNS